MTQTTSQAASHTITKSSDLAARRASAIPRGVATAAPYFVARAENAEIHDVDGRRLIDFASGIAVLNTGHRHPEVVKAVEAQLQACTHAAFQVMGYESYIALAEKLNQVVPVRGPAKSIFFTTGAEAVENAIKIARAATGRPSVIAFGGAFHGRTLFALALTGKAIPYKYGLGPIPGDVFRVPFPVPHRNVSVSDSLNALEAVFKNDAPPDKVAAIILEPVQGEGGFNPAPRELMSALRQVCDKHGIMLIADEIQTGFARTGKLFAMHHHDAQSDLIVMAKSLGGGLPLSAVTGTATIMDKPAPGALGGTYGGPPLACAAGLAVLRVIENENLCARANDLGARVRSRLEVMRTNKNLIPIGNIRGPGSMLAFDIVQSHGGSDVVIEGAKKVTARAHEHGLILLGCGQYSEAIRLLYPLTISNEVLDEGLNLLQSALQSE